MARSKPRRIMVIGLDGLCKKMAARMAEEGVAVNMARLMRRGTLTRMIPVVPAQTPTNWTTLGTGAYPGTHGVTVWGTHEPGLPITEHFAQEAMSSNICRAEYLWEAAARQGLNSLLVNYVGYPPTCDRTHFIEWAQGPTAFHFQIARPGAFRAPDALGQAQPLALRQAKRWRHAPASRLPALEADLSVAPVRAGKPTVLRLLVVAAGARGYDTVYVGRTKDGAKCVPCRVGEWSDWTVETFHPGGKRRQGSVRFKLIELSPDAERVWLYHSQVYPLDGFCYPPGLGADLTSRFGPFVHEAGWNARHVWQVCDDATCEQELTYFAKWVGRAAKYLIGKLDLRVFYMHYHLLDSLNHRYLSAIDPAGAGYGRLPEHEGWAAFRQAYAMVDKMVGELMKAAGRGTILAVCSDHGDVPNRRAVSLWNLFKQKGWVQIKKGRGGRPQIDWTRTKVYYNQNHLWLNLKGRDPQGCVKPSEYEPLRQQVLDAMLDLKDPQDGARVIELALKREDAACLGLRGPAAGDVVFYYAGGYRWSGPEVFAMGKTDVVFDDPGGANHGPQPPTYQTEVSDNAGALILAGPGVRKGYVRDESGSAMFTADLVPTLAHLAGIDAPFHAEGKVVRDLLVGHPGPVARTHQRFDVIPQPPKRKRKVTLAGDVTDEE